MSKIDEYQRPQAPDPMWTVTFLPSGVSGFSAQPNQVHQLVVSAPNHLEAQFTEAVQAMLGAGWTIGEIVPAGRPSSLASGIHARAQRAAEDAADPIPGDLRGVNGRPPIGLPDYRGSVAASLPPALTRFGGR